MKIHKNDQVLIISGKDRGKKGKVLDVFSQESKIVVEGVSVRKKNMKPKKSGEKGQLVHVPAAFSVANAVLICPKCSKPTRVGYKILDKKKYRICKKCQSEI
ncbi:MAG: 50S ribosomal protein L24 [Candidatus Nealsonbacteria bacterium]